MDICTELYFMSWCRKGSEIIPHAPLPEVLTTLKCPKSGKLLPTISSHTLCHDNHKNYTK